MVKFTENTMVAQGEVEVGVMTLMNAVFHDLCLEYFLSSFPTLISDLSYPSL